MSLIKDLLMPITYEFDQKKRLILTKVKGALTVEDTIEYFACLQQDEACPEDAIEIVDFTNVADFVLRYKEMKNITGKYQGTKAAKEIVATIFVCPTAISFGIGRMLQTLHAIANDTHKVIIAKTDIEVERFVKDFRSDNE